MIKHLYDPIYEHPIHFLYGSEEELLKAVKKYTGAIELPHDGQGRLIALWDKSKGGEFHVFVWVSSELSLTDARGIGVVAHECLHAVECIMVRAGIKFGSQGQNCDETYAYYLDYLVRNYLSLIRGK